MATIKIPISYSYNNYPFSPEATRYSKKLAERKAKKTGFYYSLCGILLLMGVCVLLFQVYPEVNESIMMAAFALGLWAGLDVNRMINKWYEMRIEDALKHIDMASVVDILRQRESNQSNSV